MATCSGPAINDQGRKTRCDREARAHGLCMSHFRQWLRRGRDMEQLTPLRLESGTKLPGLTVSTAAAAALKARGPSLYEAARDVLESWSKDHPAPARRRRRA